MENADLLKIVEGHFDKAQGLPTSDIAIERAQALNYYMRELFPTDDKSDDTTSHVVTSDVQEIVDGLLTQLMRIFSIAENLGNFAPTGPDDIASAKQQSDYVNFVFFKENPAFLILFYWFFDALTQKNGIVAAYWDDSEHVSVETYTDLLDAELGEFIDDDDVEILEQTEKSEPIKDQAGQEVVDGAGEVVTITKTDIQIRRVTRKDQVSVEPVPPWEYRISSDASSVDPRSGSMVGRERLLRRSKAIKFGFDEKFINDAKKYKPAASQNQEKTASQHHDDLLKDPNPEGVDPSQEFLLVREGYVEVDYDGDGKTELRQIFTVGGELAVWAQKDGEDKPKADRMANKLVDRSPFHVLSPHPLPHRHFGMAAAEKGTDLQEINSTLVRQMLMNLYHVNNPRHGVDERFMGDDTLDDLLDTHVGGVVRFDGDPNAGHKELSVQFTAGASFGMLEYFERKKRDRTGVSNDGEGLSPTDLKNIQRSVFNESRDMSTMKPELIARIFAETGIRSLLLHIHELTLKNQRKEKVVELSRTGEFVPVKPSEWRKRFNMTMNIGLGIGSREQRRLDLESVWQNQKEIVDGGGLNLIVTPQNIYQTAVELALNAGLKAPEKHYTDPGDQVAPPPSTEQQQLQQAQLQVQRRQQQLDAQTQANKQAKLQLDMQTAMIKHREKMAELKEKSEERIDKYEHANNELIAELDRIRMQMALDEPGREADVDRTQAQTRLFDAQAAQTRRTAAGGDQ